MGSFEDISMERMRQAASRATELIQGTRCLVLAIADETLYDIRLRAAAGFADEKDLEYPIERGSGVAAAQEYYRYGHRVASKQAA